MHLKPCFFLKQGFWSIVLIFAVVGIIAVTVDLLLHRSVCVIWSVIGIPCPACGLTRAIILFIRRDVAGAFVYHPLFPLVLALPMLFIRRGKSYLLPGKAVTISCLSIAAAFIVVWVARMIILFPHSEPMLFNNSSLAGWLLSLTK